MNDRDLKKLLRVRAALSLAARNMLAVQPSLCVFKPSVSDILTCVDYIDGVLANSFKLESESGGGGD